MRIYIVRIPVRRGAQRERYSPVSFRIKVMERAARRAFPFAPRVRENLVRSRTKRLHLVIICTRVVLVGPFFGRLAFRSFREYACVVLARASRALYRTFVPETVR